MTKDKQIGKKSTMDMKFDIDEIFPKLDNFALGATAIGAMVWSAMNIMKCRAGVEMKNVGIVAGIVGTFVLVESYLSAFLSKGTNVSKLLKARGVKVTLEMECYAKVEKHGSNSGVFYKWKPTDLDFDIIY